MMKNIKSAQQQHECDISNSKFAMLFEQKQGKLQE